VGITVAAKYSFMVSREKKKNTSRKDCRREPESGGRSRQQEPAHPAVLTTSFAGKTERQKTQSEGILGSNPDPPP